MAARVRLSQAGVEEPARRIRADLPFRRVALVLSGGGGLGAYEVGVFRALESAGMKPSILLGVSVGAMNALVWVGNGFRSDSLREVWRQLRPESVGMRWATLAARALGAFLVSLAVLESLLSVADVPGLRLMSRLRHPAQRVAAGWHEVAVDVFAWVLVAAVGAAVLAFSGRIDELLARLTPAADPDRVTRALGKGLLVGTLLYLASLVFPFPWPHRFHLVLILSATMVWLVGRALRRGGTLQRLGLRLLPETGGRGIWKNGARRRMMEGLLPEDVDAALFSGTTRLIMPACDMESGRMHYFVNGDAPIVFADRLRESLGDAMEFHTRAEAIEASLASSAVPVVFEPVVIGGREYVDGGVFSNQPLHAVIDDGADALLLVLLSPSGTPPGLARTPHLLEIAGRLPQLANWRDLQSELKSLPAGWRRDGDPARLCVVEPEAVLPGSMLVFEPATSETLMRLGEADAWRAMERALWLGQPSHTEAALR